MVVTDNPEYEHFKYVANIQSWIKTQPHLPQNIRESLLLIPNKNHPSILCESK